jgi:6-pyruvoyl-tetrahydropterin synthase
MKLETFYDFRFRAKHSLPGAPERSISASYSHWHSYTVRLWFSDARDQDQLSEEIETGFRHLHGSDLTKEVEDSTDEGLAAWFLGKTGCLRVRVTNDERRGAEATQ